MSIVINKYLIFLIITIIYARKPNVVFILTDDQDILLDSMVCNFNNLF